MSLRRAALCVGGATLMAAWFAAAASEPRQRDQPPPPSAAQRSETERLAAGVQAQAVRLRERLATAPAVQQPVRNPFTFERRDVTPQRAVERPVEFVPPPPAPAPAPALILVGIAEQQTPAGVVRIAMLSGNGDDVLMAKVGESLIGRYQVVAIDPEAVELKDTLTGELRRLVLR